MDFLTNTNIGLFIIIVAPGFLSLKIWGLIHPTRRVSFADSLYEAIFYGVLNYFLVVLWLPPLFAKVNVVFEIIAYIFSLVVVPFLLPFLWKGILSLKFVRQKTVNSVPKAWDFFFTRHLPCFMLVHLTILRYINLKLKRCSMQKNNDKLKRKQQLDIRIVGVYQPILTGIEPQNFVPPKGGSGARYLKIKEVDVSAEKKN